MKNLAMEMELLEEVTAPGDAQDAIVGACYGLGAVAAVCAIIAFT